MSRLRLAALTLLLIFIVLIGGFSVALYFFSTATEVALPPLPAEPLASGLDTQLGRALLMTLKDEFTEPTECVLRFADNQYTEGTLFAANGRLRADFLRPDGLVTSLIVVDQVASEWTLSSVATTTLDQSVLGQAMVAYTCRPWTVDASVFMVPGA